jgi:hypothetical protein
MEQPGLRQRMPQTTIVETEECPAWKDNDQQPPGIDFAPDFQLSHE